MFIETATHAIPPLRKERNVLSPINGLKRLK